MSFSIFVEEYLLLMLARLVTTVVLCGLIGFERELKNRSAGFRTHILVGVGSCLMMLLSLYGFVGYLDSNSSIRFDPSRIPSYVISGVGFLGAGTILVHGLTIRGLTTAASIWVVAGIGLVIGAGLYGPAVLATIVVLISLILLNHVESVIKRKSNIVIQMTVYQNFDIEELIRLCTKYYVDVQKIEMHNGNESDKRIMLEIKPNKSLNIVTFSDEISHIHNVLSVWNV
ncbi:MgtC/SapB family protein [Pontibacillus litoralis]|uniref:ATPase n=2 Tax=Pontibacillus TaxID=289201 RepID=A0A0A5G2W3_9BACI|nr:MgtC/SapB family protein [Pontibacillus litoralis]KGX85415.1 ATPase [Pontibacillus litoralis JSM 072002]